MYIYDSKIKSDMISLHFFFMHRDRAKSGFYGFPALHVRLLPLLMLMGLCLAVSAALGAASTGAFKMLNIFYASIGAPWGHPFNLCFHDHGGTPLGKIPSRNG